MKADKFIYNPEDIIIYIYKGGSNYRRIKDIKDKVDLIKSLVASGKIHVDSVAYNEGFEINIMIINTNDVIEL